MSIWKWWNYKDYVIPSEIGTVITMSSFVEFFDFEFEALRHFVSIFAEAVYADLCLKMN